jgi:hypothetical protein
MDLFHLLANGSFHEHAFKGLRGSSGIGIAVLGERAVDNKRSVYIRDAATGNQLRKVGF